MRQYRQYLRECSSNVTYDLDDLCTTDYSGMHMTYHGQAGETTHMLFEAAAAAVTGRVDVGGRGGGVWSGPAGIGGGRGDG